MAQIKKLVAQIRNNPQNVRFNDLVNPDNKERVTLFIKLLGKVILV